MIAARIVAAVVVVAGGVALCVWAWRLGERDRRAREFARRYIAAMDAWRAELGRLSVAASALRSETGELVAVLSDFARALEESSC